MNLQGCERKRLYHIDVTVRHVPVVGLTKTKNSESQTAYVRAKIWNRNLRQTKQDLGFPYNWGTDTWPINTDLF